MIHTHLRDNALISLALDPTHEVGTKVYGHECGAITGVGKDSDGKLLGISAQILIADHRFVEFCSELEKRGITTISEVINELISKGHKARAIPIKSFWKDIDTFQALLDTNEHLLSSEVDLPSSCVYVPAGDSMEFGEDIALGAGVKIQAGTKILGPSLVMPESTISANSIIGPNVSLSEGTIIGASSSIENAIVFGPGTTRRGNFFSNVIIFKNQVIQGDRIE
jgi:NDP-sugar pyrophosphorylase family protein